MQISGNEFLRGIPPLSALPGDALPHLLASCYAHTLPPGTMLLEEGRVTESAFLLLEGAAEVTARYGNRSTILAIRKGPAALCFLTAVEAVPSVAGFATCTPSRVLFLPAVSLRTAFAGHPPFAHAVMAISLQATRDYMTALKHQKLRTSAERLALWLLESAPDREGTFDLPYDKRRIAALLGMTPENLTRSFAAVGRHGVKLHNARVTITDLGLLKRFARREEGAVERPG
jgi:CRP/FNR family transcriptional activator FtrB